MPLEFLRFFDIKMTKGRDIISTMPDDIIECFLVWLPLVEVITTSYLCNRWRSQWTKMSEIAIDNDMLKLGILDFVDKVERLQSFHEGKIHKFVYKNDDSLYVESDHYYDHLDHWIACLYQHHPLQYLELEIDFTYYRLECVFFFDNLVTLNLRRYLCQCLITPWFRNLKTLMFKDIMFEGTKNEECDFIDLCPNVEART